MYPNPRNCGRVRATWHIGHFDALMALHHFSRSCNDFAADSCVKKLRVSTCRISSAGIQLESTRRSGIICRP
jgi:hypothetical protein